MSNVSNDSGLDDSAIGGANVAATRMSWFLAEVDEGALKNGEPTGRLTLCVLHSMDLLEADASDKYITRCAEFRMHNKVLEARLLLAADDRRMVDAALAVMSKERRVEPNARQLLVQFVAEEGNRLVQQVVLEENVTRMPNTSDVVELRPDYLAKVLHICDQRDQMEKMLLHVKSRCFDLIFNDQPEEAPTPMNKNTWLLVQYSPEPEMVVYELVSYSKTVWRQENHFKDVITYLQLPSSDVIVQAIVMAFSQNRDSLQPLLSQLIRFSLKMVLPKPSELDGHLQSGAAMLLGRSSLFQRAEQRDLTGENKKLRRTIETMNEVAQDEAQMIIDAFNMVDDINKNLQCLLKKVDPPAEP